jgi:hypothetical protein
MQRQNPQPRTAPWPPWGLSPQRGQWHLLPPRRLAPWPPWDRLNRLDLWPRHRPADLSDPSRQSNRFRPLGLWTRLAPLRQQCLAGLSDLSPPSRQPDPKPLPDLLRLWTRQGQHRLAPRSRQTDPQAPWLPSPR